MNHRERPGDRREDTPTVSTPTTTPDATERPDSRRGFLRLAGVGAAGSAALFLTACGDDDDSSSGAAAGTTASTTEKSSGGSAEGDLKILNYALTLEFLEADFYKKAAEANLFKGAELELVKKFGESEQAHVDVLTDTIKQLGGTPVTAPETTFPLEDRKSVLELAATVENLGAAAYLGKAGEIKSPEILAAALSIHSVEARHAGALNHLLGKKPTPDGAFAKPADEATVLEAVKPFIVS
jgi:rubrerythrin